MAIALKHLYCILFIILERNIAVAWNHDVLRKVYDKRVFEVHDVQEEVRRIVDAHHSRVLSQQEDSVIPILGCGPTIEYHKKREEVLGVASFADIANVLHADGETCMVAHVKSSHLNSFEELVYIYLFYIFLTSSYVVASSGHLPPSRLS